MSQQGEAGAFLPAQYMVFRKRILISSMAGCSAAIAACVWAATGPLAVDTIQTMVPASGAVYADGQVYLPSGTVSLPLVQSCDTPSQLRFADGETIEANEVYHASTFTDACPARLDRLIAVSGPMSGPFSLSALQSRLNALFRAPVRTADDVTAFCEKDCRQ